MTERIILIADKDTKARKTLAYSLDRTGYQVKLADSPTILLHHILENTIHSILIADQFAEIYLVSEIILLVKKTDPQLKIILFSQKKSHPIVSKMCKNGIFSYHSPTVTSIGDQIQLSNFIEGAHNNVLNIMKYQ